MILKLALLHLPLLSWAIVFNRWQTILVFYAYFEICQAKSYKSPDFKDLVSLGFDPVALDKAESHPAIPALNGLGRRSEKGRNGLASI